MFHFDPWIPWQGWGSRGTLRNSWKAPPPCPPTLVRCLVKKATKAWESRWKALHQRSGTQESRGGCVVRTDKDAAQIYLTVKAVVPGCCSQSQTGNQKSGGENIQSRRLRKRKKTSWLITDKPVCSHKDIIAWHDNITGVTSGLMQQLTREEKSEIISKNRFEKMIFWIVSLIPQHWFCC